MHSNYIRMINLFQSHYFSLDCLSFHTIVKFDLLVNLDCAFFHGCFVIAYIDNCKCTLADCLTNLIIFEQSGLARVSTGLK
jgi:hypothetical protein